MHCNTRSCPPPPAAIAAWGKAGGYLLVGALMRGHRASGHELMPRTALGRLTESNWLPNLPPHMQLRPSGEGKGSRLRELEPNHGRGEGSRSSSGRACTHVEVQPCGRANAQM